AGWLGYLVGNDCRCGHRAGRKCRASSRRADHGPSPLSDRPVAGRLTRRPGSAAAEPVRGIDHCADLCSAPDITRNGRQDVYSAGHDSGDRSPQFFSALNDGGSGAGSRADETSRRAGGGGCVGARAAAVSLDVGESHRQDSSGRLRGGRRARRRGGSGSVHRAGIRADHGRRHDRREFGAPPEHRPQRIAEIAGEVERLLLDIPEVRSVISRTGANELGTDPMGMELSDMYILLKPESAWQAQSKTEIEEQVRRRLEQVPGIAFGLSQPIAMRVDELVSGVRSQVAVKLFGDDLEILRMKADEISRVLRQVRGISDLRVEQVSGLYYLKIDIDRARIARYGINVAEITEVIEAVGVGIAAGEVFEGQWRFPIMVRFPDDRRTDVETIAALWVTAPDGSRIPLRELADIRIVEGPAQISREHASRRIVIEANVVGRDLVGAVEEAQTGVARLVRLPPGYYLTWGGQFENQQKAMARLDVVVPLVIGLIFLLLYFKFGNLRHAALILLAIPFAMVGGLIALLVGGLYLSVPASVGFIALFGVAVLNGVVKIAYITQLREQGLPLDEAVLTGMVLRLRPVLMTATVAALGLTPLLFASGPGSEVQKPLATVVIGGLISSTALTLIVLPVLYRWMEQRIVQRCEADYQTLAPRSATEATPISSVEATFHPHSS